MNKRNFEVIKWGSIYRLPKWEIENKKINQISQLDQYELDAESLKDEFSQKITFLTGDRASDTGYVEKGTIGILHEQLLAMIVEDLKYKSTLVPSRETAIAITKLQEALFWLEEREKDREARKVLGTYNK